MSDDSGRDPLEGVPAELRDWHQGAIDGDPAVCAAPQSGKPGYPCVLNTALHAQHQDVFGNTWNVDSEEPLYVATLAPVQGGRVTIQTRDHGVVVLDEPAWCNRKHINGGFREDIQHQAEDSSMVFDVDQGYGPAEILTSFLHQRPFSPTRPEVTLGFDMSDQFVELDPAGVDKLAAALVEHAAVLRAAARRLSVLRGAAR
ncbi:hypothetical protein BGM19_07055 [Streptomyces agglomeratus]|uniref:DUF6907 domain-containing protein n=1 Tax=Streptomyces agglomeratus TaxID=285458 RepID=UPI00086A33F2|nr:hypothetical protein [Streptomyces agglomeratus]OEJ57763.1 hypothetical protein BGM19_07055 [Streptomyces agglomeratus]